MLRLFILCIVVSVCFGEINEQGEFSEFSSKNTVNLHFLPKIYPETNSPKEIVGCFLNGSLSLEKKDVLAVAEKVNQCSVLILADGGANQFVALLRACENLGTDLISKPICLIGDLDSITSESLHFLKTQYPEMNIMKFPRAKDFTDLEAAIQVIKLNAIKEFYIFSALGKRIDHELGNIFSLFKQENKGKISIYHSEEGNGQLLFPVMSGQNKKFPTQKGQTISLIPLNGPAFGVKTSGLHWNLDVARFDETICGISNIANANQVSIQVERGGVLCIVNDFVDQEMYDEVEK